jgi:hypothetical protein
LKNSFTKGDVYTMERRILYIIGGAIVLVLILIGISVLVIMPAITSANNTQASATPTITASPTPANRNPYAQYLKQYGPDIKNQIAQGLHLTADQLTTQLKAGQSLSSIATAQGISATQLQTIITNAFQTGLKPAVDAGNLTQKQVDVLVKRMQNNPKQLERLLIASSRIAQ